MIFGVLQKSGVFWEIIANPGRPKYHSLYGGEVMIYWDDHQCPVTRDGDGMDSAVRIGLLGVTANLAPEAGITRYVDSWGLCVRHPYQYPATNKWNFTKDQLKPLVAGLSAMGHYKEVRKIFWAHVFRFGYWQNNQRDIRGTWKFPWPHSAQDLTRDTPNDSRFYIKGDPELRLFDFADPVLLNDWWFLIRGGRMWWFYWLAIGGIPFYIFTLWIHGKSTHNEENQAFSEACVLGDWALKLYKKLNPRWRNRSQLYWLTRGELEYHKLIEAHMIKRTGSLD